MAQIICYEVFPKDRNVEKMRRKLVKRHDFAERHNQYGVYFYKEVSSLHSWQIKTILDINGYKYKSFDKRYSRDTTYRKRFFENNKGPYRCAYCGRRLKSDELEVDHLVPVAKAKESVFARTILHLCGITNVNNHRNLVSSCSRCNGKKSDKMGLWVIRGAIGRHHIVWTIRDIVVTILVLIVLFILWNIFPLSEIFSQSLSALSAIYS